MKSLSVVFVAITLACVLESSSANYIYPGYPNAGAGPPIQVEEVGSGFSFFCNLIPAIDCDEIIRSLPPYATKGDIASILAQLAATLTFPNAGGILSQNPLQGPSQITLDRLGGGYSFACRLVPAINCEALLKRLPANANESDAAAELAYLLAQLRFPASTASGAPVTNWNYRYLY